MKLLLVLICFLSISTTFADEIESRRQKIINIIDEEIGELKRLSSQKRRSPGFLLRLAELNLEKARLFREKENSVYLNLSEDKRRKVNKSSYFKNSTRYFNEANSLCQRLVRDYPNYSRIGEAYYILGFNAKEANRQKTAAKYLAKANRKSKDKRTQIKTRITLAEVYYNEKKYQKAIPLYESALGANEDKWWTKDAYNLAWCYYQVRRYSKAISLMNKVHKKSQDTKYVNMSKDVERDLGIFYATSGKIKEGIKFYDKVGVDFSQRLVVIARNLESQGLFNKANSVFNYALKNEKNSDRRITIHIEKLELYDRDRKMELHQKTANYLFAKYQQGKLDEAQAKTLKFQLEKVGAFLQRQAIGKTYRRLKKIRTEKAEQAISYFYKLSLMDLKRSDEFKYLMAETAFATKLYAKAYEYYKDSFNYSVKMKRTKFKEKSMDGQLATLQKRVNRKYDKNIETFEAFLDHWKTGKKAKGIYPRLFNNYMAKNDYAKAKSVLDRFQKNYPEDYLVQEAMIAKLMDVDRKNRNNVAIRSWITSIDKKEYAVSGKFKRKLQELLTTLQIEKVQTKLNEGDKKFALVGYHNIIKDPYSTKRSKINAKYNLAVLYYEIGDAKKSYSWAVEALKEMDVKDTLNFSSSFITISNFLFTSLEFSKSAKLSDMFVNKICKTSFKKKEVSFKNAIFIYLADGNHEAAINLLNKAQSCKISERNQNLARYEILKELRDKKDWTRFEQYVEILSKKSKYSALMIDEYLFLKRENDRFDNKEASSRYMKKAMDLYYNAKKRNASISMESLDYFASLEMNKMKSLSKQLERIKLEFPEKKFQESLGKKLQILDKMISVASKVQATGSGVGIVNSFKLLQDVHLEQAKEVFTFTPKGKSADYVKAFKADMNTRFGTKFKQSAFFYKNEAKKAIEENLILNQNNFYFQETEVPVQFYESNNFVIMDRGGIQ